MPTHQGSCHCGRATFELTGVIRSVMDCNCSLCRRGGALWHGASEASLRILTVEDALTLYQFNTLAARHYFCRHCGIHPFTRPRLDPTRWAVNVRCIDSIDLAALTVRQFDCEHWEDAAQALLDRQRKPFDIPQPGAG